MVKEDSFVSSSYWDVRLSWASAAFFIGSVSNASLKTILPIPDAFWGIVSGAVGLGIILLYAFSFKEMYSRASVFFRRSVSIFVILYLLSGGLIFLRDEPLGQMITGTAFLTFVWWIPSGLFACSVYDKSILYKTWVKASYIISAFSIAMFFFHTSSDDGQGTEYNMFFGFNIILPLLIQINEFLRKKRMWLLLLVVFEVFTVIVYASRGILLSLVFFGVYKFAFESDSRLRKILSTIFLVVMGLAMFASIETIASFLLDLIEAFGVQSRSIEMLASGTISDTSGRDEIWEICFEMVKQRPLLGWGLGGEYYEIASKFAGVSGSDVSASSFSPHNGVIQNFVNFGMIGGIISTLVILIPLFYLDYVNDRNVKILIVIFGASRVIPNLISGDGFFIDPKVAVYLFLFYAEMSQYSIFNSK